MDTIAIPVTKSPGLSELLSSFTGQLPTVTVLGFLHLCAGL